MELTYGAASCAIISFIQQSKISSLDELLSTLLLISILLKLALTVDSKSPAAALEENSIWLLLLLTGLSNDCDRFGR